MAIEEILKKYPRIIRVIEIRSVAHGTNSSSDSINGYFPTTVRWCDPQIDRHLAEIAPDDVTEEDIILIEDISPAYIGPGLYERHIGGIGEVFFSKD